MLSGSPAGPARGDVEPAPACARRRQVCEGHRLVVRIHTHTHLHKRTHTYTHTKSGTLTHSHIGIQTQTPPRACVDHGDQFVRREYINFSRNTHILASTQHHTQAQAQTHVRIPFSVRIAAPSETHQPNAHQNSFLGANCCTQRNPPCSQQRLGRPAKVAWRRWRLASS